ncbi:chemotaxis-specific protein-glutamate methyltransferase CheB [bacterium]|nr:chemotaxis-specific protein-glutamate methyltransferase CheB [bacterium]
MTQYRVIVVDDEILLRQGLSARLSRTVDLKVVGVCSSGSSVLERLAAGSADAVVLDLEMNCSEPQSLLRDIREKYPEILVLALAPSEAFLRKIPQSLITPGRCEAILRPRQNTTAEAFLDDLAATVRIRLVDMLRSAERARSSSVSIETVPESRSSIIAPIQEHRSGVFTIAPEARSGMRSAASLVKDKEIAAPDSFVNGSSDLSAMRHSASDVTMSRSLRRVEVLAIASSTGGPQALTELLAELPRNFPVPIVIVQHMPAEFTKNLADRLDATCALTVREAAAGDVLQPGQALIAPGDQHMVLRRGEDRRATVTLNQGPMENSCRPAADVLFRSVADIYGASVLGVVLTGMGKDGLAGTKVIRDAGGRVIVQDEASSVVWGMPGEIARAGLADAVLPLRELPGEIMRRIAVGRI